MEERTIRIQLLRHEKTGLLVARSDDLLGLAVHGKTAEEIAKKLPSAIRDLLEAEGYKVIGVTAEADDRISRSGFGPPAFIASASLASARTA